MPFVKAKYIFILLIFWLFQQPGFASTADTIIVKKCGDFQVSGDGANKNWKLTDWIDLPLVTSSKTGYSCKAKVLYSSSGIYFLFSSVDKKLGNTMQADFLDLWNEDVIETFLWPDTGKPAYLEYEISPLNYELPIIVLNKNGHLNSWQPFHYDSTRRTRHATAVTGGEKKSQAAVEGWTAEFFIPFSIMALLTEPPHRGSVWRGNLCRIDYDQGETLFSWHVPDANFHDYRKFGNLRFD